MTRLLTGILIGAAWLLILFFGPFLLFWVALTGVGALALYEYLRMVLKNHSSLILTGFVAVTILPVIVSGTGRPEMVMAGMYVSLLLLTLFGLSRFSELENGFQTLGPAGFAIVYPAFCFSHIILLRALPEGAFWLLVLTAITASSDSAAYYAGSLWGKTKLCPGISPGKTRIGALGGLVGGGVTGVACLHYLFPAIGVFTAVVLSLGLVVLGMIGDLLESIIKRSAGFKDSATWLAGHGGVLDRCDSLMLSAPLLFYLLYSGLLG